MLFSNIRADSRNQECGFVYTFHRRYMRERLRGVLVLLVLFLILLETLARQPNLTIPLRWLDYVARDSFVRIHGAEEVSDVVIVAIDDTSFAWTGYQWPWPRAYLAEIIDAISAGDPAVIGVDILLVERSADAAGDRALVEAVERAPQSVLLVRHFQHGGAETLAKPWPELRAAATALGTSPLVLDSDAVLRRTPAYTTFNGEIVYNWIFHLARLFLNVPPPEQPAPDGLTFAGQRVPLYDGTLWIKYFGPAGTFPTYSAVQVVEGDVLREHPDAFRGKIVLLGVTSPTLQDVYPTPFSAKERMAGVEVFANAVETVLRGRFLREAPLWFSWVLTALMAALAWRIVQARAIWKHLLFVLLGMLVYLFVAYWVFVEGDFFLPAGGPLLALALGVLLSLGIRAATEEVEKRRVRQLFSRFVSPQVVEQLLEMDDLSALNRRTELTVLFSDIRNFTALSEHLTPEEVVSLLNLYLEAMTTVIHQCGGTVDKYEGDAILAFFGAPLPLPDHPEKAVEAALAMREALREFKAKWRGEFPLPEDFDIGVGISTGEVFVGLLGPGERLNYTVIGDHVNLAVRLQEATKTYNWPVLLGETTAARVKDAFELEFVEAAHLKGRSQAVGVYKLLGRKAEPTRDDGSENATDRQ